MKIIAITGHTSGLSKQIYEFMLSKNYRVVGLSRTTGYDLLTNYDRVIEAASKCDYFFNNCHIDQIQSRLIEDLHNVCSVITSGSMAADAAHTGQKYRVDKLHIEQTHKRYKKISKYPMLLLKMGYLENYHDKYPIEYKQVLSGIDYWIDNPRVSMIEFDNHPIMIERLRNNSL